MFRRKIMYQVRSELSLYYLWNNIRFRRKKISVQSQVCYIVNVTLVTVKFVTTCNKIDIPAIFLLCNYVDMGKQIINQGSKWANINIYKLYGHFIS